MKRAYIIEDIANKRYVEQLCKNICHSSAPELDDLAQMIYEILLTYDEQKIVELYQNNQLGFFIVRVIKNQYFSNTSPFHKELRRFLRGGDNLDKIIKNETY